MVYRRAGVRSWSLLSRYTSALMKWPAFVPFAALLVAVVALVFAVWPVVASPPWESTSAPDPCVELRTQLTQAKTVLAVTVINAAGREQHCWR